MKKDRTISTVLFKAAELAEKWDCDEWRVSGCQMINITANKLHDTWDDAIWASVRASDYFELLFKPECTGLYWWGMPSQKLNGPRILALYLAAHAAYSEGL